VPRILLQGGTVVTGDGAIHPTGFVLVEGERLAAIGEGLADPSVREAADRTIEASDCVIMPGFVNAHTHLYETFLRGLRDDLNHQEWGRSAVLPNIARLSEEDFYLAALVGAVENLHSGATTIIENHFVHSFPGNTDQVARALVDSGIRAWLARGAFDRGEQLAQAGFVGAVDALVESKERYLYEVEKAAERWHGAASGRVHMALAGQAAWLCSREFYEALAGYGSDHDMLVHTHCAETSVNVTSAQAAHGMREVDFFQSVGLLRPGTQLVHSVWLDEHEISSIAASGAAIVHCPVSNAYLASGVAPIPAMLREGAVVALATDGSASNNRQDSFESLKMAVNIQKVTTLDAAALLRTEALQMAWTGGARAVGRAGELGILARGALADVVVVSLMSAHLQPVHSVESALVFNAIPSDVLHVFVGGTQVIENGRCTTIDEGALLERCAKRAGELGLRASPLAEDPPTRRRAGPY
jgi:5-methylthioadenosine/S-adenosylhomocysteine deaminase